MSGFSGKSKRIFNLSFATAPILVQGFAYNMVQYVMGGLPEWTKKKKQKKKKIHKFLNKEKDKKIYHVWVDRYVTVVFLKFWYHGEFLCSIYK